MRLKPARLHAQANMPHGAGHTLMQLAKRDNIALKTGPDHLRAAPPPPFPKSPQPANAQVERSHAHDCLLQRTREGRGLALLKLSQECQRDVHGVRRHPTNIVFGVQVPESPNQRA